MITALALSLLLSAHATETTDQTGESPLESPIEHAHNSSLEHPVAPDIAPPHVPHFQLTALFGSTPVESDWNVFLPKLQPTLSGTASWHPTSFWGLTLGASWYGHRRGQVYPLGGIWPVGSCHSSLFALVRTLEASSDLSLIWTPIRGAASFADETASRFEVSFLLGAWVGWRTLNVLYADVSCEPVIPTDHRLLIGPQGSARVQFSVTPSLSLVLSGRVMLSSDQLVPQDVLVINAPDPRLFVDATPSIGLSMRFPPRSSSD